MKIDPESADPKRPYANLLPITDALLAAGNEHLDGGFVLTPAGYVCRLAKPIDVALVRARFSLPPTIEASGEYDTILDRLSWVAIEGPGADDARRRTIARDIAQR